MIFPNGESSPKSVYIYQLLIGSSHNNLNLSLSNFLSQLFAETFFRPSFWADPLTLRDWYTVSFEDMPGSLCLCNWSLLPLPCATPPSTPRRPFVSPLYTISDACTQLGLIFVRGFYRIRLLKQVLCFFLTLSPVFFGRLYKFCSFWTINSRLKLLVSSFIIVQEH